MKSAQFIPPYELLRAHLARKQQVTPDYSLRALARDVEVSSSYLSAVFNGKKPVPLERLPEFARRLEIDSLGLLLLKQAIIISLIPEEARAYLVAPASASEPSPVEVMAKYEDVGRNEMDLWSRWYHIAILDLSTCEDFQSTPEWIGNRLGLKSEVVATALDYLKHEGYLTEVEGRLQKAAHHVRLPMTKSKAVIRAFHSRMMNKAAEVMESQTGDAAYANRLISGITVASNPKSLERAKERLSLAAHEVADILSEGPCTEVYHLGFQLFPLTK